MFKLEVWGIMNLLPVRVFCRPSVINCFYLQGRSDVSRTTNSSYLVRCMCSNEPSVPKNIIADRFAEPAQLKNGRVYDDKPFRMRLYPNKRYFWCLCGLSKTQPMCDGTHKVRIWKCTLKPVPFEVSEEKDYWLCNCKQTKLRPFCDGTHKTL